MTATTDWVRLLPPPQTGLSPESTGGSLTEPSVGYQPKRTLGLARLSANHDMPHEREGKRANREACSRDTPGLASVRPAHLTGVAP